nr:M56 family metallopeptidase [uncultured Oscillibacter sp.]
MKEILLTSSVLIAALLLLRRVFRNSISRRLQYALWALVALRLLVPANLPALEHNVLTAADPVVRDIEALYITPRQIAYDTPDGSKIYGPPNTPAVTVGPATPDNKLTVSVEDGFHTPVEATTLYQWQIVLEDLLRPVWYAGMAVMAVWFLLSNLLFWQKLRRRRTPYPVENCDLRVYLVEEGLPSPCLFGLSNPAIYLTPAAVSSPEALRHVLAHEETHARHLDPLWSLLRAVCLTVYWFDPLVWAAAVVSRSDCELACDEGAILRLGEAERIPYGKTLLSLIPVGRGPVNPLLSATTMTAGKRQLRDRVTRIAQNRRTVGIALFAVIALSAAVCAATFTGAAAPQPREDMDSAAPKADGPLTRAEMLYFNEEFFSSEDGFNLRGQFLTCLYERPEDIDLFSLFYNGVGSPDVTDEAERRAIAGGEDPGVDLTKFTTAEADAALLEHTGLTLEETNRVDLDTFRYFPQYDAYYLFHGDTNAVPIPDFFAGEREGDTIRLYYEEFRFGGYGVFCLTLEEREDGGWWFRSHTLSEMPAIPPVYPAGEPWMTVSLKDLEPYQPQAMEVERRGLEDIRSRWDIKVLEGYEQTLPAYTETLAYKSAIIVYQAVDGAIRAAVEDPDGLDCFFTFPEGVSFDYAKEHIADFNDLLGHSGVSVSYNAQKDGEYFTTFNDYYTFGGDGRPYLLARACGDSVIKADLDGDGQMELASAGIHDVQIFFQRDGRLYEADVLPLLAEQWTEPVSFYPAYWDKYGRSLTLNAEVPFPDASLPEEFGGGQATGTAVRQLFFDGEALRLYRDDDRPVTDHVMEGGVQAPEEVLEAARQMVHDRYEYARTHTGVTGGDGEMLGTPAEYDDWRLEVLGGPWTELLGNNQRIEIWNINYEFHTTTPKRVILAGGAYLTEDAWHCNTYPGCTYLYFLFPADGPRRYLYTAMENDCAPGTEMFRTDMAYALDEMGAVPLTDLTADTLMDMIQTGEVRFLNYLAEREDGEAVIDRLRFSLTARWGTPLDGLTELHFRYTGSAGEWNHKEMYQYYVEYFDTYLRPNLTEGGAALWERLTDQAAAPADRLLPTLEDIRALAPAEAAEAVYQRGKANLTAYLREPALYDGWRVSNLTRETGFSTYGLNLAVYSAWFELHPSQPDKVVLAGGMDFTEDGWVKGLMSASPYLVFLEENGHYTLLESDIPYDTSADSPAFQAEIAWALLENQRLRPSQIDGETLLTMLGPRSLNLWGTYPEEEQEAVLTALDAFHNQGPQELQMDLRDRIQTTVWTQRDLDERGAALFQKLLKRTGIQAYGITNTATNHLGSAIHNALHYWRENASAHEYDFHEEAYYLLDTQRGGSSCTVHLLVSWGHYELTEDGYELAAGGDWNAMAVSFSYVNDRYQATEIWEPHGGGLYEPEVRACFPEESAEIVFAPRDSERYQAIHQALDDSLKMYAEAGYEAYLERQAG